MTLHRSRGFVMVMFTAICHAGAN